MHGPVCLQLSSSVVQHTLLSQSCCIMFHKLASLLKAIY
jgi:hypothetical protein